MNITNHKVQSSKFKVQRTTWLIPTIICLIGGIIWVLHYLPQSRDNRENATALIRRVSAYDVMFNGKKIYSFGTDSAYEVAAWVNRFTLIPSSHGTLMTRKAIIPKKKKLPQGTALYNFLAYEADSISRVVDSLSHQERQIAYYLRVHGVQDRGFNLVSAYYAEMQKQIESLKTEERLLDSVAKLKPADLKKKKNRVVCVLRSTYTVFYPDSSGKVRSKLCHVSKDLHGPNHIFLQTADEQTPESVTALKKKKYFKEISRENIYRRFGAMAQLSNLGIIDDIARHPHHKGRYSDRGMWWRQDSALITGEWNADTLISGTRRDSLGTYIGDMNRLGQANGHGKLIEPNGNYYEGYWKDGERSGWGFQLKGTKKMRAGEWKADRYLGERVEYNADRIYGIDVSRYQHDIGRKHYSISWNALRISHLGSISRKTVQGVVDYKVSFAYIKSTEGVTLLNRYYRSDIASARRAGIHVGTYHFFSLNSKASLQAKYFLKHSSFRKGDFPPVLDVEPLPSQIKKIGGADELFARIRVWMRTVKRALGVRPVLYVNQIFVNKYLDRAPDIKRNYDIWIARYGEYKPDINLVVWQLSPDGRVRGIHGEVDINVFNGYQNEFQSFLENKTIK